MINLNDTPDALQQCTTNSRVTVDGSEYIVNRLTTETSDTVYLTKANSRGLLNFSAFEINSDGSDYDKWFTHVRRPSDHVAIVPIKEMVDMLTTGSYIIG